MIWLLLMSRTLRLALRCSNCRRSARPQCMSTLRCCCCCCCCSSSDFYCCCCCCFVDAGGCCTNTTEDTCSTFVSLGCLQERTLPLLLLLLLLLVLLLLLQDDCRVLLQSGDAGEIRSLRRGSPLGRSGRGLRNSPWRPAAAAAAATAAAAAGRARRSYLAEAKRQRGSRGGLCTLRASERPGYQQVSIGCCLSCCCCCFCCCCGCCCYWSCGEHVWSSEVCHHASVFDWLRRPLRFAHFSGFRV